MRAAGPLAYLGLLLSGFGWSLTPVLVRLMRTDFDPYTLAFFRYGIATIPLLAMSVAFFRRDLMRAFKHPAGLVPLALIMIAQQYTWVMGLYSAPATTAHLVLKLSVVFIVILAYILFREERTVIQSPFFLAGAGLSFVGVSFVLMDGSSAMPRLDPASAFLLLTALFWAIYTVGGKHLVRNIHPVPLFTVLAVYTTAAYAGISFAVGRPEDVLEVSGYTLAILAISGLFPIALAHPCFHFAQKHLGSSYCSTFNLFTPVITYSLASVALPEETLLPRQVLGAAILIGGTLAVTLAERRAKARAAARVPAFEGA